jgi:hypothetical protein
MHKSNESPEEAHSRQIITNGIKKWAKAAK